MPGTQQTLFEAFGLAEQQGLSGSPLERALGVFGNNDPRPSPFNIGQTPSSSTPAPPQFSGEAIGQPEQSTGGGLLRAAGRVFQAAEPIFQGSSFLDTFLPGDPGTAIKNRISDIPVVGEVSAEVLDNVLSPATFLVAARGVQVASALSKLPVAGKFAGAFVDPILRTGSFGARMGVESSAILGGTILGNLAEDAPFPVQLAASLGGALVGARSGLRVFGNVADPAQAVRVATAQLHPTGTIAEVARLSGAIDDVRANQLAAIDDNARQMRSAIMDAAARGHGNFVLPSESVDLAQNQWELLTARELHDVDQLPSLMMSRIENTKPVEGLLGYIGKMGHQGRAFARIFNGNVDRNPVGRAVAEVSFNYAASGVVNAGNASVLVRNQLDEAFGKRLEKLVLRDALALDEVDTRRLSVLEGQLAQADKEYVDIRKQLSALAKNQRQLDGLSGLEEYGVMTSMNVDRGDFLGRLSTIRARKNQLQNEVDRLRAGAYATPDDANKALADARRYLRQYRDGLVNAAPNQDLATHSQLMTLVAENQSLFHLTDEQKAFFDNYANFTKVDEELNRAFGVDFDPVDNFYVQHVSDWVRIGADGAANPVSRSELTSAFADRTLAQRRGFQFPRTFHNMLDWMRALENSHNPGEWNARLDNIIEGARAKGDLDEVARLEALRGTDIVPIPRRQHFSDTIAGRMAESYGARAEHLAKAVADEFGPEVRREVDELLIDRNISDLIRVPAQAAGFLRSALLRMDLSMVGVQGLSGSAMMVGPNAGTREFVSTMTRVLGSDQEFAKWWLMNGDRLSYWSMNGMVFAPSEINIVTSGLDTDIATDMLTGNFLEGALGRRAAKTALDPETGEAITQAGARVVTEGKDYLPFGKMVKTLDKIQFARGITMMKAYTAEHLYSLAKAARQDDGFFELAKQGFPNLAGSRRELAEMSDEQLGRFIAGFVNDIYGGRNRVMLGRTQAHQMVESLLMLTPGFTRGTLATAVNTLKPGAQGALARDYAMRSLMIAGGLVSLLSMAFGGVTFEDGKPKVNLPNLFDPSANDWFDIHLPGGRTIRPMSRFRSLGRMVFGSLQEAAINGNWEKATQYWTDDSLRWMSYRQSALISTLGGDPIGEVFGEQRGNSFARNLGLKDILFNPSDNRRLDIAEMVVSNTVPIIGQSVFEQVLQAVEHGPSVGQFMDVGIGVGSELLGVGTFGPTLLESAVSSRAGELALAAGMDERIVAEHIAAGRSPLYARDNQNRYILDGDTRNSIIERIAGEFEIPTEVAARGGKRNDRDRRIIADAVKEDQLGRFLDAQKTITEEYEARRQMLDSALDSGAITPMQYSEEITKLRIRRAGARWGAEESAPAALVFLESDDRAGRQNATDAIYSAISQEAFAEDFIDPETGTFDFDAREQHMANLEAKYGEWFYKWQKRQDADKSPTELERDQAYRTLGQYFDIADQAWTMTTGGALGTSEREFDRTLNALLAQQGVPEEYLTLARTAIKRNIPVVSEARTVTRSLREALRALNPDIDAAAQKWLGVLPLGS